jgi:hypothetical protein
MLGTRYCPVRHTRNAAGARRHRPRARSRARRAPDSHAVFFSNAANGFDSRGQSSFDSFRSSLFFGHVATSQGASLETLRQPTNDILDRAIDDLKGAVTLDPTSKANNHALQEAYLVKREAHRVKPSYPPAIENFNKDWQGRW